MSAIPESVANLSDPVEPQPKTIAKPKPIKALPTDRLTFDTQLGVLRAYAAASGHDMQPISNADVGKVADLNPNSVSLCNPFFVDCGLLIREGQKQRPSQAVFDYHAACEWNRETAGQKLHGIFSTTWFAKALLPKLGFRALSVDEAVSFLAEEAKAPKDYKAQLLLLIDYLAISGVIVVEGNTVTKANGKREFEQPKTPPEAPVPPTPQTPLITEPSDVERFSIPIPGKPSAVIIVPKGLDADDWDMLNEMMGTYIKRWKKEIIRPGGPS